MVLQQGPKGIRQPYEPKCPYQAQETQLNAIVLYAYSDGEPRLSAYHAGI